MKRLNLGCGQRYHPDWTNVDFAADSPAVQRHDLRKPLPFPDGSFDFVYHSHVLEHFDRRQAPLFLRECARVLRPGGVIRVAVPDLEGIVRLYLARLEAASSGDAAAEADYDWMMLELYDQAVRTNMGGGALEFLSNPFLPNEAFLRQRWGAELDRLRAAIQARSEMRETKPAPRSRLQNLLRCLTHPREAREQLLRWLLGPEYAALKYGRFRERGVLHQWMYDRFSLSRLLRSIGFGEITRRSGTESYDPAWNSFHLDTEPDGSLYKPDSLFVEGRKC